MGICPKCGGNIQQVNTLAVTVDLNGRAMKGISYLCPSCNCVLSVAVDPVALNTDLRRDLNDLKALVQTLAARD